MNKHPLWSRLWVNWLVLTGFYLILCFWSYLSASPVASRLGGWVGVFVPYGFWNAVSTLRPFNSSISSVSSILIIILAILSVIVVFSGDKIMDRILPRSLTSGARIIINLIILLALTFLVDMVIWHTWASGELFKTGIIVFN